MVTATGQAARILSFLNEVKEGNVVHGKYLIQQQLASGGMGTVFAARHVQLGTKLAIKVLLPELLGDVEAIERFAREARAAAKLADENVVRIVDVGQLESGAPFMVMEFLEGQDAAAYLKKNSRMPIEMAMDVGLQTCAAVAAAHALGIIHRDLKPSNLFFVPRSAGRPLVKVLDFGVSKIAAADTAEARQKTKTGSILGSPAYVAPEQWLDSKSVDQRSDIWALGIVLYELLTGRPPFDEASVPVLATKIAYDAPASPRQLRQDIPPDLERVILRCLEKKPEDRFQDVAALAKALGSAQRHFQALNSSTVNQPIKLEPTTVKTALAHLKGLAPASRTMVARSPKKLRLAAVALAASLVVIGMGLLLRRGGSAAGRSRPDQTSLAAPRALAPSPPPVLPAPAALTASVPAPRTTPATTAPPRSKTAGPRRSTAVGAARPRLANDGQRRADSAVEPDPARCKPPYYFNAQGIRVFKLECL